MFFNVFYSQGQQFLHLSCHPWKILLQVQEREMRRETFFPIFSLNKYPVVKLLIGNVMQLLFTLTDKSSNQFKRQTSKQIYIYKKTVCMYVCKQVTDGAHLRQHPQFQTVCGSDYSAPQRSEPFLQLCSSVLRR